MENTMNQSKDVCTSNAQKVQELQFILQARPYLELESYKVNLNEYLTGGGCSLFSFAKADMKEEDMLDITLNGGEYEDYIGFSVEFCFRNKCTLPDETAISFVDDVQMVDHDGKFLRFKDLVPEALKPLCESGDRYVIKGWFYVEKIDAEETEEIKAARKKFAEKYFGKEECLNIQVLATNGFVWETFHTDFPLIFDGKEHKVNRFEKSFSKYWISGEKYCEG